MAQQFERLEIIGGPDKGKLLDSLGGERGNDDHLFFTLKDGRKFEINLQSVEREDGSGKSFNLRAYVWLSGKPMQNFYTPLYYRTDTHKGHVMWKIE